MKKIYFLSSIYFLAFFYANAQKVSVIPGSENLGDGYNPAFKVFIPHANAKTVEKKWNGFLKDYKAKVKSSKDEITAQNFLLPERDTLQVFSNISEKDNGVVLNAAFSIEGTFVSPDNLKSDYDLLSKMLHDFALPVAKDALDKKAAEAASILSVKTKEQENLTKRNEQLRNSNEKMKEQINDNEREINDNEQKIGKLKDAVNKQKNEVEEIISKSKELD